MTERGDPTTTGQNLEEFVENRASTVSSLWHSVHESIEQGMDGISRFKFTGEVDRTSIIRGSMVRSSVAPTTATIEEECIETKDGNKEYKLQVDIERDDNDLLLQKANTLRWDGQTPINEIVLNILNYVLGIIILTMPYCLVNGGYSEILSMVLISLLMYFTANNMATMLDYFHPGSYESFDNEFNYSHGATFQSIMNGERRAAAHGYLGLITYCLNGYNPIVNVIGNLFSMFFILCELYFNVILYFIFGGKLLYDSGFIQLFGLDNILNEKYCSVIVVAVVLPTLYFRDWSANKFVRIFGVLTILITCIIVYCEFIFDPDIKHDSDSDNDNNKNVAFFTSFIDFGHGLGPMFAIYSIHAVIPNWRANMKEPRQFKKAISIVWSIIFLLQFTVGIIGAITFGNNCDLIITSNFGKYYRYIVCIFLIGKVWSFPALCLHPIVLVVESTCCSKLVRVNPILVGIIYILLVGIALGIALGFPDLLFVVNLIGSFCAIPLGLVLPSVMYVAYVTKMKQKRNVRAMSFRSTLKVWVSVLLIVVMPIVGVWNILALANVY